MNKQSEIKKRIVDSADRLGISALNKINLPNSLLIIPDGNGRWAQQMGFPVEKGHELGGNTLTRLLEVFVRLKIKIIGIWGFSEDNWKRDKKEIDNIMNVVKKTVESNLEKLQKYGIKFMVLGNNERIAKEYPQVYKTLEEAVAKTKNNTNKILALFLDYGERLELENFAKERQNDTNSSTYELLSKINKDLPMFDMVLRTSGEQRISGFGPLSALAEFITVKKNLPELEASDLIFALKEYAGRQRRFGAR